MTDIDSPVHRRTNYQIHGRRLIASLTKGGVNVRLERTQQGGTVSYDDLWKWIEQSKAAIPPRKK